MTGARYRLVLMVGGVLLGAIAAALIPAGPPLAEAASPPVPPSCAPAPPPLTFASSASVAIPDGAATASQIVVTGLGTLGAWDIDVVTRIRHPAPGELEIELVAPTGVRRMLSSGNGGTAADVFNGTLWDDSADRDGQVPYGDNPNLATDHPYAAGIVATPLAPEQGLIPSFIEGDGVWSLAVSDTSPGNTGSIDGWSLSMTPRAVTFGSPSQSETYSSSAVTGITPASASTVTSTIVVPRLRRGNSLVEAPRLFVDLPHTRSEDLDVTVTSPAGTVATLTTDNGGASADAFVNSSWNDHIGPSSSRVTDITFPTLTSVFSPEEPLGAFVGEDPTGTWTLTVHDDTPGEGGSLNRWSLTLRRTVCAPNVSVTITQVTPRAVAGRSFRFDVTATAGPTIPPIDMSVQVPLPPTMRFRRLIPQGAGACEVAGAGLASPQLRCTWPGPTGVGTSRTMRVVVQPFVAGFTSLPAFVPSPVVGAGFASALQQVLVAPSPVRAANGKFCTITGTPGPDTIRSTDYTNRRQVICGFGGRDRLSGSRHGDTIDGGPGDDVIDGRQGADRLFGGHGRDNMTGGAGADLLVGGPHADALHGGPGRDTAVDPSGDTRSGIEVTRGG